MRAYAVSDIRNGRFDLRTTRELTQKEILQKKYTGNWIWRAMAALLDTDARELSPIELAKKLNVSIEEAVEAIDGLIKLGIVRHSEKGYEKVLKFIYFSDRDIDPANIQTDHVLVSSQLLARLNVQNKDQKAFYRTAFVSTTDELFKEFSLNLENLMKEFIEKSTKASPQRVVAMSFTGVGVTQKGET